MKRSSESDDLLKPIPSDASAQVTSTAENDDGGFIVKGMGIHYIHPALLEITGTAPRVDGNSTHTDWMRPSVLIYEPQSDGSLELVAVENLVFEAAWNASDKTEELIPEWPWLGSYGGRSRDPR